MINFAQAATDVASTVDAGHLGAGAVVAVITAEVIQIAKESGWKPLTWISTETQNVNRIIGGLVAFAAGLGISFSYDHTTGTLVINGLLATSITHGAIQWAQQQIYYRLVIAKSTKE